MSTGLDVAERKRRGINKNGKPRAKSLKGFAKVLKERKRQEAEARNKAAQPVWLCQFRHTHGVGMQCNGRGVPATHLKV